MLLPPFLNKSNGYFMKLTKETLLYNTDGSADILKKERLAISRGRMSANLAIVTSLTSYSDFPIGHTLHQFMTLITTDSREVSIEPFSTGVACQQETLTLPDTLFRPFL